MPAYPPEIKEAPRQPVVAGSFYPGSPMELHNAVDHFYSMPGQPGEEKNRPAGIIMVPHAGYLYSGGVCAVSLRQVALPSRVILLGPCHQHRGPGLSLWPGDAWLTPLGGVAVDQDFYSRLLEQDAGFKFDAAAHAQEHSLEVVLPFLQFRRDDLRISPIAVSASDPERLAKAGAALASVIRACETEDNERPLIIVSSDMNHYLSQDETIKRDSMALEAVNPAEPLALYKTVADNNISMCGVLPMTLALCAAKELGATKCDLLGYSTSGAVSKDNSRVVGYAGLAVS